MSNRNRFTAFLVMIIAVLPLCAQNFDEVRKQINTIKKNSKYIYADETRPTEQDAHDAAESALYDRINEWAATQKKLNNSPNLVINNKEEIWAELRMPRGNQFRSFVYVKKSDIKGADNATVIENTSAQPLQSTVEEVHALEVPTTVKELSSISSYADFANKLQAMKAAGKVSFYGRYASLENPDIYYLAIYDRQGTMRAYLTPAPNRKNIASGKTDDVTNYSGCGAIGFLVTDK